MMDALVPIITATLIAGTPLVFASLGELVTEKSGVLNLGVEGMMLIGAITGFITTLSTDSMWLGMLVGALCGAASALPFAFIVLTLQANQVATGLALAILGTGVSAFIGKPYVGVALVKSEPVLTQFLRQVPLIGGFLGALHPVVYISWIIFALTTWFLYRTRSGLILRAVGESPSSAHANGYDVIGIRYLATIYGGALAGIGGAFLGIVYTSLWIEGLTAGRGWIALALVVFATWRPARVLLGAYLFGGVTTAQLFGQGAGIPIPPELMSALPYAATIIVLVVISRNPTLIRLNAPASLGQPFHREA